jgi:hypothetical protein
MRITIARLTCLVAIGCIVGVARDAFAAKPTTRESINEVIRQNEASRAKIRTIEFDYTIVERGSGHYAYRGNDRANNYVRSHGRSNTNCIMTDRFIAYWEGAGALPVIYHREAGKPLTREVMDRVNIFAGYDPLWCGFGSMFGDVNQMFSPENDRYYRVEEGRNEQNERVMKISWLFANVIGDMPQVIYEFNVDRGYLITGTKGYNELGWLTGTSEITTKQIDGVWVPTHARRTKFIFKAGSKKGEPRIIDERDFTNIRVNQPIDAAKFEIASLQIPEDTTVLDYDASGTLHEHPMSATTQPAAAKP